MTGPPRPPAPKRLGRPPQGPGDVTLQADAGRAGESWATHGESLAQIGGAARSVIELRAVTRSRWIM